LTITELSVGVKVVRSLADCLMAIGHPTRLRIVEYCSHPHSFTDIILNLRLNPASFRFHSKVLMDCGLLRKAERGVYETTNLGKDLVQLVKKATDIAHENA